MTKQFIKQIMLIGSGDNSIQTDLAMGINIEFDMDNVVGSMSFNLPYIDWGTNEGVSLKQLKKRDTVKLFYGEFDSDPGNPEITEAMINSKELYIKMR